jgi:hypothetical protein
VEWAAGLFEGEGCITRRARGDIVTSVRLQVDMTDHDVLMEFMRIVGVGNVTKVNARPGGEQRYQVWRWACAARADVISVLERLLPYMGERRAAKARAALLKLYETAGHRSEFFYRRDAVSDDSRLPGVQLDLEDTIKITNLSEVIDCQEGTEKCGTLL